MAALLTTVNMLCCMPTMVLLDQNLLKGSVIDLYYLQSICRKTAP